MDRRQIKTRAAIFEAFGKLLATRKYDSITVQEIIDEADIGRSTFYAHFETKEALLRAMCSEIFDHIFVPDFIGNACQYTTENKAQESILAHILYHLKESKTDMSGLLTGTSGEHFMIYFKDYLYEMISKYFEIGNSGVPREFILNHLTGSFAEAVRWWMKNGMKEEPETIARYYMSVVKIEK